MLRRRWSKPFEATTCIHRAGDLFKLEPSALAARCRLDACALPPDSRPARLVADALCRGGRLSWHKPSRARPDPGVTWWIVFGDRLAAPVRWEPEVEDEPLVIVGLADHRPVLVRWLRRLRRG